MTLDNTLRTGKTKMAYGVIAGVFAATLVYSLFELNADWVLYAELSVLSLLLLTYATMLLIKLDFFYINDDAKKLTVRFYSAHPIFRKYKQIVLEQSAFSKFEIRTSFFGMKHELYLTASTKKGEFTYPPVSISLLSKTERDHLVRFLNKYRSK